MIVTAGSCITFKEKWKLLYCTDLVVYPHVSADSYSKKFMHESKQMFVPDAMEFLPGISETLHREEWFTDHQNLIS